MPRKKKNQTDKSQEYLEKEAQEKKKKLNDLIVKDAIMFWLLDPSLADIKDIEKIDYEHLDKSIMEFVEFILKLAPKNIESPRLNNGSDIYLSNDKKRIVNMINEVANHKANIEYRIILYAKWHIHFANIAACEIVLRALRRELKIRS